jgi:hypothetical protein
MELHPSGRLVVLANATLESGQLRLLGSTTMAGRGRLLIEPGAEFYVDHSLTFPGSIETRGLLRVAGAPVVLQTDGTFILAASGTLNNPGTVRVGSYLNFGGTIIGHAPVRMERTLIDLAGEAPEGTPTPADDTVEVTVLHVQNGPRALTVELRWLAPPGSRSAVEMSCDLRGWTPVAVPVTEIAPGSFAAQIGAVGESGCFFRLRWTP